MQQTLGKQKFVIQKNPTARTVPHEKSWQEKAAILAVVLIPPIATVYAITQLW